MEEEKELAPISLDTPIDELNERILKETDMEQFDKIKSIFDLNIKKKEILRLSKLSDLQDLTIEEMSNRLRKRSGEFSNQDLIGYFKTVQDTINKSDTSLDNLDVASIKVVQNQVNIHMNNNEDELNRDEKNRVIEAIRSILNKSTDIAEEQEVSEIIDVDVIDSEDDKIDTI